MPVSHALHSSGAQAPQHRPDHRRITGRPGNRPRAASLPSSRPGRPALHTGFTLLELLLVVVLLLLFSSAAVMNITPLWRNAPLEEGVGRLEGLLRFARAEAAQQGRRVRLQLSPATHPAGSVNPEPTSLQVQWEPEPLLQPGVFVHNLTTAAMARSLNELVRVESIRHLGPDGGEPPPHAEDPNADHPPHPDATGLPQTEVAIAPPDEPCHPITFYPDGSSDSAEILLAMVDPADSRRMLVRWNGLNGTAAHEAATADRLPDTDGGPTNAAQPLEPSSVAHTSMGPTTP